MKILTIVGARPNFMKASPIIAGINEHNRQSGAAGGSSVKIQHILVHTGQHYDEIMSGSFFTDLNLPAPDVYMGVGSGSHAVQTAEIMKKFEEIVMRERPEVVVVVGDVNSTVACALVASKVSYDSAGTRPLIAHVEAGLRSFDRTMPEEINRVVTDHVSDLLFVTEESGHVNLKKEGIPEEKIHFVGNTMIDSLLKFMKNADASTKLEELGLRACSATNGRVAPYALLTLHRPANVDNRISLENILGALQEFGKEYPVIFPVHPRTRKRLHEFGIDLNGFGSGNEYLSQAASTLRKGIVLIDPLGYLDFLCLMKNAAIVITDSGGIQEETTCLSVPCVTVRENTERPVTVERGTNIIAGTEKERVRGAIREQMSRKYEISPPENWDGQAARRIVEILVQSQKPQAVTR